MDIPKDFNPKIPTRRTAAFNDYVIEVTQAAGKGADIACRERHGFCTWASVGVYPEWDWTHNDYAILPEPKLEWPTNAQWCKRFTDLRWQAVLIRTYTKVYTGRLCMFGTGWGLVTPFVDVDMRNHTDFQISLDGGQTWKSPCEEWA